MWCVERPRGKLLADGRWVIGAEEPGQQVFFLVGSSSCLVDWGRKALMCALWMVLHNMEEPTGGGFQLARSRATTLPALAQLCGYLHQHSGWVPTAQHRTVSDIFFASRSTQMIQRVSSCVEFVNIT